MPIGVNHRSWITCSNGLPSMISMIRATIAGPVLQYEKRVPGRQRETRVAESMASPRSSVSGVGSEFA